MRGPTTWEYSVNHCSSRNPRMQVQSPAMVRQARSLDERGCVALKAAWRTSASESAWTS